MAERIVAGKCRAEMNDGRVTLFWDDDSGPPTAPLMMQRSVPSLHLSEEATDAVRQLFAREFGIVGHEVGTGHPVRVVDDGPFVERTPFWKQAQAKAVERFLERKKAWQDAAQTAQAPFRQGDKVECVDVGRSEQLAASFGLVKGHVYTVKMHADYGPNHGGWHVTLVENERVWEAKRFRKYDGVPDCSNVAMTAMLAPGAPWSTVQVGAPAGDVAELNDALSPTCTCPTDVTTDELCALAERVNNARLRACEDAVNLKVWRIMSGADQQAQAVDEPIIVGPKHAAPEPEQ